MLVARDGDRELHAGPVQVQQAGSRQTVRQLKAEQARVTRIQFCRPQLMHSCHFPHLPQHASVITQPEASCPLMLALQQHAARKHEQRQLPKRQAQERAAAEAAAAKEAEAAAKAAEQAGGGVIAAVSRVLTRSATSAQRTAQQAAADAAAEQQRQLEQRQASERKAAAAAVKDAEALLKEFLKAWRPSFLAALMAANLSPDQRELVSEFAREHAGTVLAPLLQVGGCWAVVG